METNDEIENMERYQFLSLLQGKCNIDLLGLIESSKAEIKADFVLARIELWEIYENRYEMQNAFDHPSIEGMKDVVEGLATSALANVRLTALAFPDGECSIFSSPDYSVLIGCIVYP